MIIFGCMIRLEYMNELSSSFGYLYNIIYNDYICAIWLVKDGIIWYWDISGDGYFGSVS